MEIRVVTYLRACEREQAGTDGASSSSSTIVIVCGCVCGAIRKLRYISGCFSINWQTVLLIWDFESSTFFNLS